MTRLNPEKLNVRTFQLTSPGALSLPRRYTLTHSDKTGELFLTIGSDYDYKQIKGWYTRLMRDEVLAEWKKTKTGYSIHVYCQVSRGFGTRGFREAIFRRELPLVIEAFRYGDRELFENHPNLDETRIIVHFCARNSKNDSLEDWGLISQYAILPV
jgi:hypothetical protein